jgi:N-acetyl-alpha-D-muramate 1-phosphate uridylyltransferase
MTSDPAWRPRAAFVLAAGLGTRMRHLSTTVPKPLVPLKGVPLIDRVLDRIADAGIPEAVVNVHYLADRLEAHLAARPRPRITISDERGLLLETGGGVVKALTALPQLIDGPFLIHNSDSVWIEGIGRNLDRLCAAFDSTTMDSLMLLAPAAQSIGYEGQGDFNMEPDGRLARRGAGEQVPFVFAGVSIAHPRLFDGVPAGAFSLNAVWNRAIQAGRLYGVRMEGIWMHVGTPEAVAESERRMEREEGS